MEEGYKRTLQECELLLKFLGEKEGTEKNLLAKIESSTGELRVLREDLRVLKEENSQLISLREENSKMMDDRLFLE